MRRTIGALAIYAVLSVRLLSGQGFPPTVTKTFTPSTVAVNQVSTLTITLTNANAFSLTGATLSDTFPSGLVNAGPFPGTAASTCPNAFVGTTPTSLMMVGGVIPANGSCTITAPVTSPNVGSYQNDTGSLFFTGGSSLGGGTATLTVLAQIPALSDVTLLLLAVVLAAVAMTRRLL